MFESYFLRHFCGSIGQSSKDVRVIYIIAKGTADDIVWEQIQKKYQMLEATVGRRNEFSSSALPNICSVHIGAAERNLRGNSENNDTSHLSSTSKRNSSISTSKPPKDVSTDDLNANNNIPYQSATQKNASSLRDTTIENFFQTQSKNSSTIKQTSGTAIVHQEIPSRDSATYPKFQGIGNSNYLDDKNPTHSSNYIPSVNYHDVLQSRHLNTANAIIANENRIQAYAGSSAPIIAIENKPHLTANSESFAAPYYPVTNEESNKQVVGNVKEFDINMNINRAAYTATNSIGNMTALQPVLQDRAPTMPLIVDPKNRQPNMTFQYSESPPATQPLVYESVTVTSEKKDEVQMHAVAPASWQERARQQPICNNLACASMQPQDSEPAPVPVPTTSTAGSGKRPLSPATLLRIENNRKKALEILQRKRAEAEAKADDVNPFARMQPRFDVELGILKDENIQSFNTSSNNASNNATPNYQSITPHNFYSNGSNTQSKPIQPPATGNHHVFMTGGKGVVKVSADAVQRASFMMESDFSPASKKPLMNSFSPGTMRSRDPHWVTRGGGISSVDKSNAKVLLSVSNTSIATEVPPTLRNTSAFPMNDIQESVGKTRQRSVD